ncbi:hypothetical protein [Spirilliplanes yamanashiensis]|uniref:N-(5'-phosphoribosyl)anthranilate isomerase n=1 Tax=Spirilliplanes yamanashiensis TaxID=42233 RepID=A0A8J4DH67_9ACTN|nr:hypothetical protein [Spirilliplanes yamanashiensis]MDP9819320.1 phosphoribosylanthranilate isomerase [Spirilliplanes yamanashiensis]GIJ01857.1 hypothetical protein Sya03_12090 [Spirilliplanes yamanashiensis]
MGPLLKVCGATRDADPALLAGAGAGLVGLWHGVPGGPAELSADRLARLADAVRATGTAEPVLVTFLADVAALTAVLRRTGIRWVQLHAYQPPGVVRALKAAAPDAVVVKVLHLRDGACVESRFVPFYTRAGTDLFLLDRVAEDGRVGSTGVALAPGDVLRAATGLPRPFLLAGGLGAGNAGDYAAATALPGYAGIDVDTAARAAGGAFDPAAVAAIAAGWGIGAPAPS